MKKELRKLVSAAARLHALIGIADDCNESITPLLRRFAA
jgi:hypothetical protein